MIRLSIRMYLCFCLVVIVMCGTDVDGERGSDKANCSCYYFDDNQRIHNLGKYNCKNGTLVSMETTEEWEFIKKQIQNQITNEWWIGLQKRDGRWEWMSKHNLTYDKWLRGKPDHDEETKFVTIVKEFNGTQGMFNTTRDDDLKGSICEYHKTNCSDKNERRWCRSTPLPPNLLPTPNTTTGLNESDMVQPRYPSKCAVIKKTDTPVIIPIMVALAGLLVIVAFNIIIVSWRRTTVQESSKKKDESGSHSEQDDMDPTEGTTSDFSFHGSGIEGEENVQPREDCIGKSATNSEDGNNGITDIDERCGNTSKAQQPYYVNLQESTQFTDTNGHYASVSEVNETDGQRDSFVVVRTYSVVRDDDDGQTDDANTSNYATVSDTLGTDRQTVMLVTTESGYASVDLINKEPSIPGHDNEHDTPTSGAHVDGSVKYAVSKKDKSRQFDNQNPRDDGYTGGEVIYDNCLDIPLVQEDNNTANNVPNTGVTVEYAAVNKSMKKRNRSVKETAQTSSPTETSYASGDVEYCQESATAPQVEYAAVNKSMKKRNRIVKETAQTSNPTETSYAAGDVEYCQDNTTAPAQRESRRKKDNNQHASADVSTARTPVEYAAVDKSKKRSKSAKETAMPIKPTDASYASVDVECCQDDSGSNARTPVEYAAVDKSKKRSKSAKETAMPIRSTEASYASVDVECCQDDSGPNARTPVEYAAVDKSKKRSKSAKETAMPIKPTDARYPSVDVECCQESAPVPAQRSRRKKDNKQHTQDDRVPNTGVKVEYTGIDKSKKKNTSVKEVVKPSETTEASYASVDVIYDNC